MAKIAIIGGGIIGMTAAFYLSQSPHEITLFDEATGQATKASAGIICPWLSKRRNKQWYELVKDGAAFYSTLVQDLHLDDSIYQKSGALILRPEEKLEALYQLAQERKQNAPEIGDIQLLSAKQTKEKVPLLKGQPSLYISGGAKLNGQAYLNHVSQLCQNNDVRLKSERVHLKQVEQKWLVYSAYDEEEYDFVLCSPGPHLKNLLAPLNVSVDVRPQKGQLLSFKTTSPVSKEWPVVILDGEADFIPFQNGELLLGATHENEERWNLEPTSFAFESLTKETGKFFENEEFFQTQPYETKVGTRAYTSDFSPFFGAVDDFPHLFVASGLGSSGLTVGPFIGYLLAKQILNKEHPAEHYQKPIGTYIQKKSPHSY